MHNDLGSSLGRLFARRRMGIHFGLDVERLLLEELGNPHQAYGVIHVAGTNGKGSVCSMVESGLRACGYRTGLYTSPHLVRFNERFRANGERVADDELADILACVESAVTRVSDRLGHDPTFFEFSTAIAFEYFRRQEVQLAVVETGMGGRLDATNVVTPLASVITRIALEHTEFLGDTVEEVAGEKGGIIKQGRPVVCGAMPDEAACVIRNIAAERGCSCIDVPATVSVQVLENDLSGLKLKVDSSTISLGTVRLPLSGLHQAENLATAVATIGCVQDLIGVECDPKSIRNGLAATCWQGRCQVISRQPVTVVDGAHNPDAAVVLADWMRRVCPGQRVGLILGMCGDKDVAGFLKPLAAQVECVWAVPVNNERSMDTADLAASAGRFGLKVSSCELSAAMEEARQWGLSEGGIVCITGSLFLVGEVLGICESAKKLSSQDSQC